MAMTQYERKRLERGREILRSYNRQELRNVLWLLRRQESRPSEPNPAAAQWDGLTTLARVRAEYRRRGWKVPKMTREERP